MRRAALLLIICLVASLCADAAPRVRANGTVNLPYRFMQPDTQGNYDFIYNGGWFQQQGQFPAYGEGAMLTVNGNQPMMQNNLAKLEADGEIVLENMNLQGCSVTRRIFINRDDCTVRIIDIFKNTTPQAINLPILYRSSMSYGATNVQPLGEGKKAMAGVAITDGRNRGALELYGGRGAKLSPTVSGQPNNNMINATMTLAIPAGKEVALLHLHATTANPADAMKLATSIKESKLLQGIPKDIRKLIVNFGSNNTFIGADLELLRGDAFDAAEMRGGDQIHGALREKSYKLDTFYGPVDLPAEKVISLVNVGDSRPRQLIVTSDGQIFGGRLEKQTIDLELSSGQLTKLPLSQITRLGYRKRSGEPDEWPMDKPMIFLRTGERIAVQPPAQDIIVATRYGMLKLSPSIIASIGFQNDENGVHEIYLTDGSKFAGLVTADSFDLKLAGSEQTIKIPASILVKLQLSAKPDEPDESAPTLRLANEDQLIGNVTGQYKLETTFDTLTLNGEQIKSITHSRTSPLDVIVKLWDETSLGGQLAEQELNCKLKSGIAVKIPVALLAEYTQPQPSPGDAIAAKVKAIVDKLNADDFKVREDAQKQLVAMGSSIAPILKQLRNDQPLEAQQRIDVVLKELKSPDTPTEQPDN